MEFVSDDMIMFMFFLLGFSVVAVVGEHCAKIFEWN